MKTVERAKAWLHGGVDCDTRQLVLDLISVVEMLENGEPVASVKHAEKRGWPVSQEDEE